jgi:hypothetical protein
VKKEINADEAKVDGREVMIRVCMLVCIVAAAVLMTASGVAQSNSIQYSIRMVNPTASLNAVTFNAAAATLVSATTASIVPINASTGSRLRADFARKWPEFTLKTGKPLRN